MTYSTIIDVLLVLYMYTDKNINSVPKENGSPPTAKSGQVMRPRSPTLGSPYPKSNSGMRKLPAPYIIHVRHRIWSRLGDTYAVT